MHEYVLALIGGLMIGTAAVLLMAANGQIMGVSGIVKRLLPPVATDWHWRALFVLGVVLSPLVASIFTGELPVVTITKNPFVLLIAGLIVGVGTVMGNGCTSGHGVCGLPRLSIRSMVATGTFMLSAAITVFLVRHL